MNYSEEAKNTILDAKCARIIVAISRVHSVSLETATDIFYNSETSRLIEDGVADLHCRSDLYLAEEVWRGYEENKSMKRWLLEFKGARGGPGCGGIVLRGGCRWRPRGKIPGQVGDRPCPA